MKAKMEDGGWRMEEGGEAFARVEMLRCAQHDGIWRRNTFWFFFVCFVSFVVNPLLAQPAPDPELERGSFQVSAVFEVSLWAADPMLAKPIRMNFDASGRL